MENAERVPLGGAGFDRASLIRRDAPQIGAMLASSAARVLPVWRGRIPLGRDGRLVLLPADHPVFGDATDPAAFLGIDRLTAQAIAPGHDGKAHRSMAQGGMAPIFARDISAWSGMGGDDPPDTDTNRDPWQEDTHAHPDMPPGGRFIGLRQVLSQLTPLEGELAAMSVGLFSWHRYHRFCANCGHATEISMAGWQRACPHCRRQHFPRTDPVVIMLVTHGNDLLLGRSPGWPEGMYSLLAGFMEPGETIEAAVRREVAEETRISIGRVRYLASQPWPFPSSLMIGCHAEATSREIDIDPLEIESALWMSREEVLDIRARPGDGLRPPRSGAIASFLIRNWLSDRLG